MPPLWSPPIQVQRSQTNRQWRHSTVKHIITNITTEAEATAAQPHVLILEVHTELERPYLTALTMSITSSTVSNGVTVTTGPKISSV